MLVLSPLIMAAHENVLEVPFRAPGLVHCRYHYSASGPGLIGLQLVRVFDGKPTVLEQGSTLSGERRVENLSLGSYEFRIEARYSDSTVNPPRESTNVLAQRWVSLTETNISGALLFNETLSGSKGSMDVAVTASNGLSFLLDSATVSSCQFSGSGNFSLSKCQVRYFSPPEAGDLSVADSQFDQQFYLRTGLAATFVNCRFRDPSSSLPLTVLGSSESRAVTFDGCEFDLEYGVRFDGARPVTLKANMFTGPVSFWNGGWGPMSANVLIEGNSFLGSTALSYSGAPLSRRLKVGQNYYGDFHGPNTWGFGSGRGGSVALDAFELPPKNKQTFKGADLRNRKFPSATSGLPLIYNLGVRVGQNTLGPGVGPLIRQGRETLASVELACSWKQLSGVQVYAELDGTRLDPMKQVDLYRDWFDSAANGTAAAGKVASGDTTYNILLPAQAKSPAQLKIYLDTTKSPAFGTNGYVRELFSQSLSFLAAPQRPLRLLVVPVEIQIAGYPTNVPAAAPVVTALKKMIPAMLPLKEEELVIDTDTVHVYSSAEAGFFDSWTVYSLSYTLNEWLQTYLDEFNATGTNPYDRIIGVIPAGALGGGADGVNVATSRTAMLVDEAKPTAAIHELGHSFSLYTWKEQYNIVEGGYTVDQATAFLPESSIQLAGIPGLTNFTRIRHFSTVFNDNYTDIMGSLDPQWIIPGTLREFGTAILSLLSAPARSPAVAPQAVQTTSAGKRKVLISGAYARLGSPWPWDKNLRSYTFLRGTLSTMDITDRPELNLPSYNGGRADSMQFTTLDRNRAPNWNDSQYVNIPGPSDDRSPVGFWVQTFEYTNTAAILELHSSESDPGHEPGDPFLLQNIEGTLSVTIKQPQSGATLGPAFVLELESAKPVTHLLSYSLDGINWKPLGRRLRGNQHRLASGFLPPTDHLALRVRSSDGGNTVFNTISNLTVLSVPELVMTQPAAHEVVSPVTLSALAGDASGRFQTNLLWSSSVDGPLGNGESLPDVRLSPGRHILTCTVTLDSGQTASVRKEVMVLASSESVSDPSLTTNSLAVISSSLSKGVMTLNRTNLLTFTVFNSRASGEGSLSVYAQAPGGVEELLAELFIELDAPRIQRVVRYRPLSAGLHRIRAVLSTATDDANSGNNEITWTVPAQAVGLSVLIEPGEAAAAGAMWRIADQGWNDPSTNLPAASLPSTPALINFKPIAGWRTPMPYYLDKDISGDISLRAKYLPDLGTLPYVSSVNPLKSVGLGTYVSLYYRVDGRPKPACTWTKDGRILGGSNTTSLVFQSVGLSDAGTYFLSASNTAGVVTGLPVTLVITNGGSTFAQWSQRWPGIGTSQDDPDRDGIPNLLEYALALDPTVPNREPSPSHAALITNGIPYLTMSYTRPKNPNDLSYAVVTSSRLPVWDNAVLPQTLQTAGAGDAVTVTVGLPLAMTNGAAGFMSLRVFQP